MTERKTAALKAAQGLIVNVSSIAGRWAFAHRASWCCLIRACVWVARCRFRGKRETLERLSASEQA